MSTCPKCGSEGTLLGWLGNLAWFRCRACGWEFNVKQAEVEAEESEA